MKISEALTILNITNYSIHTIHNISLNELKKYYHILALQLSGINMPPLQLIQKTFFNFQLR